MSTRPPMPERIARALAEDPELAMEFYCMASELVDDFNEYGPVLQANVDGVYDSGTAIRRLQAARDALVTKLQREV